MPEAIAPDIALARTWAPRLEDLARRIRRTVRGRFRDALESGGLERLARPVGQGVGDVTFGLDVPSEEALYAWLLEVAHTGPVSVLTEDSGWRHLGPAPGAPAGDPPVELDGFDHGGPRMIVDPIDGTRNLMHDLRSAWTVISFSGPGAGEPRFTDLAAGLVSEIPDSRAAHFRVLSAIRGEGCTGSVRSLGDELVIREGALLVDDDGRADRGYFPFFAYHPEARAAIQELAGRFFGRLREHEGAELAQCYDDQYISSGGQLALLALGHYRMIVDPRAWLRARGMVTQTAKPYDMAGAALCAREAGCIVTGLDGGPLDFALDAETPVSFVGFHNGRTGARLWPHLARALEE